MRPIIPNLWFDTEAEQAAQFYVSVFPDSRIISTARYPEGAPGPSGTVMTVEFEVNGQRFVGINGGPQFPFTEAVSFQITCETQEEVDRSWAVLTEGGEESVCGWLKDRYGLSWQLVPTGVEEVFADPDPSRAQRGDAGDAGHAQARPGGAAGGSGRDRAGRLTPLSAGAGAR